MDAESANQGDIRGLSARECRLAPETLIGELATTQHAFVARRQLLAAGLSADVIRTRIERHLLRLYHAGVFLVGPMPPTQLGRWKAASLAIEDTAVGDRDALALWGLIRPISGPVHLIRAGGSARRRRGLIVHRTRCLSADWLAVKQGIPVIAPMPALIRSAASLGPRELRKAADQAEIRDLLDIRMFDAFLAAHPNVKRRALLLETIAPFRKQLHATESPLETRFLRWCYEWKLPMPAANVPIADLEVDFHWAGTPLIVETDGFEPHRTRTAFDRDRERWSRLASLGFRVILATDHRLTHDSARLHGEILAVLGAAGRH